MNKHICILNETFLNAIEFYRQTFSFLYAVDNIVLSTICVMQFCMKKLPRLVLWYLQVNSHN